MLTGMSGAATQPRTHHCTDEGRKSSATFAAYDTDQIEHQYHRGRGADDHHEQQKYTEYGSHE
jgi:hypothetical protein